MSTALLLGIAETLFDTAAQSIMPSVVEKDRLSVANSRLYAAELTMNQFVGPPLGGILASIAIGLAFAGSALAYVVGVVALFFVAGNFRPQRSPEAGEARRSSATSATGSTTCSTIACCGRWR